MNLKVLKKSRKVLEGDIFVYQLKQEPGRYRFGRVICTTAVSMMGDIGDSVLIYLYQAWSRSKDEIPDIDPRKLLVLPLMTNKRPWTMGYFETVARPGLKPGETLSRHYFVDPFLKKVFDERGNEVAKPEYPMYTRNLASFMGINRQVSDELGYPVDETAYRDRD